MSNDKLPAPEDRCDLCDELYKDHSPLARYCPRGPREQFEPNNRFRPKPLQVEGPTRDDKRCVLQCAMGPWEPSMCPGEKCIGEAGAEATGKLTDEQREDLHNKLKSIKKPKGNGVILETEFLSVRQYKERLKERVRAVMDANRLGAKMAYDGSVESNKDCYHMDLEWQGMNKVLKLIDEL